MRNKKFIILFSIICSLTFIILISSVLFSVQHVYENCINGDSTQIFSGETTLGEMVLQNHGFKKGKSIFLADKEEAIRSIEQNVPCVSVVQIEKRFPNRIYIQYKILFDYFQVFDDGRYYILSEKCKITSIASTAHQQDKIVDVFMLGDIGSPKAGSRLTSTTEGEVEVLSEILHSLQRLDLEYYEITQMFKYIDLRNEHSFVLIKTSTGVCFRLLGWENIDLKLQSALSLYKRDQSYRSHGAIIVDNNFTAYFDADFQT